MVTTRNFKLFLYLQLALPVQEASTIQDHKICSINKRYFRSILRCPLTFLRQCSRKEAFLCRTARDRRCPSRCRRIVNLNAIRVRSVTGSPTKHKGSRLPRVTSTTDDDVRPRTTTIPTKRTWQRLQQRWRNVDTCCIRPTARPILLLWEVIFPVEVTSERESCSMLPSKRLRFVFYGVFVRSCRGSEMTDFTNTAPGLTCRVLAKTIYPITVGPWTPSWMGWVKSSSYQVFRVPRFEFMKVEPVSKLWY